MPTTMIYLGFSSSELLIQSRPILLLHSNRDCRVLRRAIEEVKKTLIQKLPFSQVNLFKILKLK